VKGLSEIKVIIVDKKGVVTFNRTKLFLQVTLLVDYVTVAQSL
jgi:hypothetical protein